MSYNMCVTHWLTATTNKRNKQKLNGDAVFEIMRSDGKYYL